MNDPGRADDFRADAFRKLFEANHGDIAAYCQRRASAATANDAVSETFLIAWRRFDDIPAGPEARLWLFGVARRTLANLRRSDHRQTELRRRITTDAGGSPTTIADPSDEVVGNPSRILDALATLDPDDQEALALVTWEGLSHAEAGLVLGCSANAFGVRIHRARRRLADALTKDHS